jgi:hypothetical protein
MSKSAPQLVQNYKRFIPLLSASAVLLLSQGQARAALTYNIFESAGNVVIQTSGGLNLAGAMSSANTSCTENGYIYALNATICTGPPGSAPMYNISGPLVFAGTSFQVNAFGSSSSGLTAYLNGASSQFVLDSSYISGAPIVSSATFDNQSLAGLGFTTMGLVGTWTLDGTSETIKVIIGPPSLSGAAVPGPLPLMGAGAAFGWSRRLRRRIAAPLSTPHQA